MSLALRKHHTSLEPRPFVSNLDSSEYFLRIALLTQKMVIVMRPTSGLLLEPARAQLRIGSGPLSRLFGEGMHRNSDFLERVCRVIPTAYLNMLAFKFF